MRPTILTVDGTYFDFQHPSAGITLEAIARGLSNLCRFNGQCRQFYSVAEHSVWVSRILPPEHALAGLLHDAAEAFIGDVTKPLKNLLPDYREIEKRVEVAVAAQFAITLPLAPVIKQADRQMLWIEQRQIMNNQDGWSATDVPAEIAGAHWRAADIRLECRTPSAAYHLFMIRALEVGLL